MCVCGKWPSKDDGGDVGFVVDYVVLGVVCVVICVGFVGENHGEVLANFGLEGRVEWRWRCGDFGCGSGVYVVGVVVDVVVVMVCCLGLENAYGKVVMVVEWGT